MDGRVVPAGEPQLRVGDGAFREGRDGAFREGRDGAFREGRGCFTTARWTGDGLRHEARHLARLERDAAALAIGKLDPALARRAFHELGRAALGAGEGVLRLQASRAPDGGMTLVGTARPLPPARDSWRAITLAGLAPGATAPSGAKVSNRLAYALARDRVAEAGVDEGVLLDGRGRLVEGTITNLVAVGADGVACAPPDERGAVAGIALAIVSEAGGVIRRDVDAAELPGLRELVALNAVRGAVAVVELDGRPIGDGRPGPVSARLAGILDAAP